jgi:hypothetical protein
MFLLLFLPIIFQVWKFFQIPFLPILLLSFLLSFSSLLSFLFSPFFTTAQPVFLIPPMQPHLAQPLLGQFSSCWPSLPFLSFFSCDPLPLFFLSYTLAASVQLTSAQHISTTAQPGSTFVLLWTLLAPGRKHTQ